MTVKETISSWTPAKRGVALAGAILSFVTLALLIWVMALPRSWQLFKWSPPQLIIFIVLCVVAVGVPGAFFTDILVRIKRAKPPQKIPGRYVYALLLIGIILPGAYLVYLSPYHHVGDKAPELMIIDQPGVSGYPNLAVMYYTQTPGLGFIDYGPTAAMEYSIHEENEEQSHVFILKDLTPGTQYFYQLNGVGTIYNFTYFPPSPDDLRFGISSDVHIGADDCNLTSVTRVLQQMADPANDYSAFFCLGDIVDMGNDDSMYQEQIALFSQYTTAIPFRNVVGNHDAWFGGIEFWKDYFYPAQAPSNSSDSPLWHRYDFGDHIHVFNLDLEWGTETYTAAQKAWFEGQLAALDPDDWIIVMNHAYYYASSTEYSGIPWYDNPDMIDTFQPLFKQYGVDLVFSGHDHQMEHIAQDGVDYFIVGAMGGPRDLDPTYWTPNSQFFDNTHYGFADVQFNGANVTVSFMTPENALLYTVPIDQ